jgi:hypothetical protein
MLYGEPEHSLLNKHRHCEERSVAAIQCHSGALWIASLRAQ